MIDKELLSKCLQDYNINKFKYQKMQDYYDGKTDAIINYQMITKRANNKVNCNFVQKFITEEASYSLGNKVTYVSHSNNIQNIDAIKNNIRHWSEKHDKELLKEALKFSTVAELYFIDNTGKFSSIICTPLNSYILCDDFGEVELFIRFFTKKFDTSNTIYADVYTNEDITHYKVIGSNFEQIGEIDNNVFGKVPVSIVNVGTIYETIYSLIKGLQDAYETNCSDIVNEISDFRNAYLKITGCKIDDTPDETGKSDLDRMKELGILNITGTGDISWIVKNINDSFIQNTLSNLEDKMYQMSSHINYNEKMQSNLSGVALRSRLISLEMRCTNNTQAIEDAIKKRIEFLYAYLYKKTGTSYDIFDIDITFTPNIPQDDLLTAQMISQLGDKISTKTALSQLSFIDNPAAEMKQIEAENQADSIGNDLLTNSTGSDDNATA